MKRIFLPRRQLEQYRSFTRPGLLEEIQHTARSLADARIVQVNATAEGGGVAEILRGMVPLLKDAGLNIDWYVLEAGEDFFRVTKQLHNQLQGEPGELSEQETGVYLRTSEDIYGQMRGLGADLWVIHD